MDGINITNLYELKMFVLLGTNPSLASKAWKAKRRGQLQMSVPAQGMLEA